MSSLESYRKQAKQFVRWHRDREWTVAQIIREHAPRFAAMSDRQILDASFKLSDAQEIVARKAGFATWAELKAGAANTPAKRAAESTEPRLVSAIAHVFVTDIARATAFYRDQLGFAIVFTYGNPPFYRRSRCRARPGPASRGARPCRRSERWCRTPSSRYCSRTSSSTRARDAALTLAD
jgi:hypothetical protein